ncbi:hypothetical protein [Promicromonospora soli]
MSFPGGSVVRWVTWAAAACAAVVVVRAAAAWSDDDRPAGSVGLWWELSRGVVRAREDLSGSVLLLAALAICVVLVWMLAPLVLVTGGLLSLAAAAVEARRLNRL